MRLGGVGVVLLGAVAVGGPLRAQEREPRRVAECAASDSLIGATRLRPSGLVLVRADPDNGRTIYSTGTRVLERRHFHVTAYTAVKTGSTDALPSGRLALYVIDRSLYGKVDSMAPPELTVTLDDSLTLRLRPLLVTSYPGHPRNYAASISVPLSPATFLALVRSKQHVFELLGRRLRPSERQLDDLQAVFRAATCRVAPA